MGNWVSGTAWEVSDEWEWVLVAAIACVAGFLASLGLDLFSSAYRAYGEDTYRNSLGDVTSSTTFTITDVHPASSSTVTRWSSI